MPAPRCKAPDSSITTNQLSPPAGHLFGDEVLAAAVLDRLLHHSHALLIQGHLPAQGARGCRGKTFLGPHLGAICAVDFFAVKMLTRTGLVRTFVLFAIDVETRRGQICGIMRQPHGAWMKRVARNLTDSVDGFLAGKRFLIHDRDPLFTQE